jgi:hypothetical protein
MISCRLQQELEIVVNALPVGMALGHGPTVTAPAPNIIRSLLSGSCNALGCPGCHGARGSRQIKPGARVPPHAP